MANNTFNKVVLGTAGDFSQYEFGAEEVLAQLSGNRFQISHLEKELEALRKQPNFDKIQEAYLLNRIEYAQKTILYKTKGQKFYKLFMDYQNNPSPELKQQISILEKELNQLQPYSRLKLAKINGKETVMVYIKGERFVLKQVKSGVSVFVPYNTTSTTNILAD